MKRTLFSGPWRIMFVVFAVVVAFGVTAVAMNAPAQGGEDLIPDESLTPDETPAPDTGTPPEAGTPPETGAPPEAGGVKGETPTEVGGLGEVGKEGPAAREETPSSG